MLFFLTAIQGVAVRVHVPAIIVQQPTPILCGLKQWLIISLDSVGWWDGSNCWSLLHHSCGYFRRLVSWEQAWLLNHATWLFLCIACLQVSLGLPPRTAVSGKHSKKEHTESKRAEATDVLKYSHRSHNYYFHHIPLFKANHEASQSYGEEKKE